MDQKRVFIIAFTTKIKTELLRLIEILKLRTNTVDFIKRLIDMISGFAGNGARTVIILKFKNLYPLSIFEVSTSLFF